MGYRLYNRLGSGGFAVQATLVAAKVDFAYDPIASRPDQPLGHQVADLNPWGQVPVLELDDGTRITETAAILAHLSQTEPSVRDGPVLFTEDQSQFLRWAVFLSVNAYEGILRCSYTNRFFDRRVLDDNNAADLAQDIEPLVADAIRQAAKTRVHAAFKCIETDTADHAFLLGDRLSACDIFLAMLYAWHNQQPDLPKCTLITTHVATHTDIRPIWEQNFHDRLDFKWHEQ